MGLPKRVNRKLIIIIIVFIISLFIGNTLFLNNNIDKKTTDICEHQSVNIVNGVENKIDQMKLATSKIARNNKVIKVLKDNPTYSDLDSNEIALLQDKIDTFEGLLKTSSFVDTINITSTEGEYLFHREKLYKNFDTTKRPWFKESLLTNKEETIVGNVHKDFTTNKYCISIVSFVYSEEDELVGAVIVDIFIDDLLEQISDEFYLGNLKPYIKVDNQKYYSFDGRIEENLSYEKKYYDVRKSISYFNDVEFVFRFEKEAITYTKMLREYQDFQFKFYSTFGLILAIILAFFLKLLFKPISFCLSRFKGLLDNYNKYDVDFNNKDELSQLECISKILSKSLDDKINTLIYNDELTGLPNRKSLSKIVNKLISERKTFALIFIDLNDFKQVNDLFGHLVGDEFLKGFANRMKNIISDRGIVTRYSGDEFIIIYTDYVSNEELIHFYNEYILAEFSKPISMEKHNILAEFSAGVAIYPQNGEILDELIKKSDLMMYKNKKDEVGSALEFFNDEIYRDIIYIELIKSELKTSIEKNEFNLLYQPIVNSKRVIQKVEVLIRWNNEKLGYVTPLEFIGYAEESGEITSIGYWIIEEVCKNYKKLTENYKGKLQVSINVSPIQIAEVDFVDKIIKIVEKYNMEYKNICFEITESAVLDSNKTILKNMNLLSEKGVVIALDDFGTGYSSFSYLKKFKLDILKIDKSFIDDAKENDYKIVENIKSIAHELDMDVVIEGVETEEQFNELRKIGCDFYQGYYFSKPLKFEETNKLLSLNDI